MARKSAKQIRFLLSKGSPLTATQKKKVKREVKSGKIRVKGGKKKLGQRSRRRKK